MALFSNILGRVALWGFPGELVVKKLAANARDTRDSHLIPWRRKWQPTLVYSSLGNPMDRRTYQAIVHRVAKESDPT